MAHLGTQQGQATGRGTTLGREMQSCIDACLECHAICLDTVRHCLQIGGKHASPQNVTLLLDCAQICIASADFMLRESPEHSLACGACAAICRACAESCRQVGGPEMERCAAVCDACAASCTKMAQQARAQH